MSKPPSVRRRLVGAGVAGSVIASRLSEQPSTRVLLLEAGGATPPPASATPQLWPTMIGGPADWGDSTTVQSATGPSVRLVRGRGIGGSSSTNGHDVRPRTPDQLRRVGASRRKELGIRRPAAVLQAQRNRRRRRSGAARR